MWFLNKKYYLLIKILYIYMAFKLKKISMFLEKEVEETWLICLKRVNNREIFLHMRKILDFFFLTKVLKNKDRNIKIIATTYKITKMQKEIRKIMHKKKKKNSFLIIIFN